MDRDPNASTDLPEEMVKAGFQLDGAGVLSVDDATGWSITPPDAIDQCVLTSPTGVTYTLDGVKRVVVNTQNVSGPGSVGIDLG
ncbi:hypothetical protein HY634_03595 [Candidatus Uhrbacteria bacterium]|nr:hypothetical protein [Candidatus Uhrbacteria bacterium]